MQVAMKEPEMTEREAVEDAVGAFCTRCNYSNEMADIATAKALFYFDQTNSSSMSIAKAKKFAIKTHNKDSREILSGMGWEL